MFFYLPKKYFQQIILSFITDLEHLQVLNHPKTCLAQKVILQYNSAYWIPMQENNRVKLPQMSY